MADLQEVLMHLQAPTATILSSFFFRQQLLWTYRLMVSFEKPRLVSVRLLIAKTLLIRLHEWKELQSFKTE